MARLIDPKIASKLSARSRENPVWTRAGKRWASSIRKTRYNMTTIASAKKLAAMFTRLEASAMSRRRRLGFGSSRFPNRIEKPGRQLAPAPGAEPFEQPLGSLDQEGQLGL